MKKFISLIITLIFIATNSCYAFSELYYLKNITQNSIQPIAQSAMESYDYSIKNQNPIYGVSQNNSQDYALIILQQSGQNLFYFYESNNNKKINKKILNYLKNNGIIYEQSQNANIINIYENLSQKTRTQMQSSNNYVFYDNNNNYNYATANNNPQNIQYNTSKSLKGYVAEISKGTKIPIYLQNAINTATAYKGDRVVAVITNNVSYNGNVVFPQGSLVYGELIKARHASYGSRNGKVIINFNQIVTPENKTYNISAEEIDFTVTNDGKVARVLGDAVVGAIVGGLVGLLVGAATKNIGSSTAIGAGIGAGGAALTGTAERGVDAEIPSFTEMEITLTKPLNVSISY